MAAVILSLRTKLFDRAIEEEWARREREIRQRLTDLGPLRPRLYLVEAVDESV